MGTMSELANISRQLEGSASNDINQLMSRYRHQIELICSEVDQSEYLGLIDLMVIMDAGLDALIERGTGLNDFEISFLQEFPVLLADYLSMPGSRIAASILVKHFKKTDWIRPITLDEQKMLMSYIVPGRDEDEGQEQEDYIEAVNLENYQMPDAEGVSKEVHDSSDNVLDIDQLINMGSAESSEDDVDAVSLSDYQTAEDAVAVDQQLPAVEADDEPEMTSGEMPQEMDSAQAGLDSHQQELIDLVKAELMDIAESTDQFPEKESDDYRDHIRDLSEQAENISNAISLMGLEGLAQASFHISSMLAEFGNEDAPVTDESQTLQKTWPLVLMACLDDIYDEQAIAGLIGFLQKPGWVSKLSSEQLDQLAALLKNPSFSEEEVESRQVTATEDDVSLSLPDDVNQELLDGLLQDLPSQAEEFSRAIHNISEGGSLAEIEVAQRIAHTLKGAANVVGVKGVANLTHHLEDILEIQAKSGTKPVPPLVEILVTAADCLESMSEALLGVDAPPDNAVQVLQSVLDWANRLDSDGVEAVTDATDSKMAPVTGNYSDTKPEARPGEPVSEKEALHAENMLRIPASLADELLRLAGENLISTGQVQERIRNIMKSQDAIQLHNQALQQISFDLEHLIDVQGVASYFHQARENDDFDPLEMDQYNEMHSVSRRLIEIAADSIQLTDNLDSELVDLHNLVISQNQLQKESQELVLRTRMVSTRTIVSRLRRGVRQACRVTGKQVELNVIDNDTYMDSEVLNELIEPLMHVLRNAVDHGIETSEVRQRSGKSDTGCIELSFDRKGDQVVINVEDDGRGLDLESIRRKAIENGLLRSDVELTDDAMVRLVLESGLTTRDEVTQVSGRGIGLDVVNVKIRELKGSINIYTREGHGCRFEIILPISSFSTHSLLVRIRENIYAISNRGVEEILYPGLGELCDLGDQTIFQLENQAYSAILIDELLDFSDDRRKIDRSNRPILLVRDDSGGKTAILVQEVLDSRDVVVKSMGHYLPKLNGIIGATVLGDGSVAPVMDLPEMLQHQSAHRDHRRVGSSKNQPAVSRLPYVLVVDDSLSARRSLAQFVQDLGMDVRTARDGMEAVSLIEARPPDLMLVDMEMPRMNGLELTSHVRASSNTNGVPVIMITSRSTDKHRAAAMEKGVNHFMVKPFIEEELAQYINDALDIAS